MNTLSSNTPAFDFLVFIGRFQPFHLGHQFVVSEALKQAKRVIILIGSSKQPKTLRNPWSFAERKQFIKLSFGAEDYQRLAIAPLLDDLYNDQNWIRSVQQTVNGIVCQYPTSVGVAPKIGLIGHSKDHSSYYLSRFPQWPAINVENFQNLSATPLREDYFAIGKIPDGIHPLIKQHLAEALSSSDYQHIAEEYIFIKTYQQGWANAPYPPVFVTVDAVVIQSGHILLIERNARPGKGQLALPGGFLDPQERLKDAVIRELREETKIKIPAPVLAGSIVKQQVFDDPHRSARGRTITHAYLLLLKEDPKGLPKVKGGDDARHALWLPLAEITPEILFEDHYHIIQAMIG